MACSTTWAAADFDQAGDCIGTGWVLAPDEVDERLEPAGIGAREITTEADRTQNTITETDRARHSEHCAEADRMKEIGACNLPLK